MSSIVWSLSPAAPAPWVHVSDSGGASSAMPASSCALSRIFAVALVIAAEGSSDGVVLKTWPLPKRSEAGARLAPSLGDGLTRRDAALVASFGIVVPHFHETLPLRVGGHSDVV